jgi:hypothetical protein
MPGALALADQLIELSRFLPLSLTTYFLTDLSPGHESSPSRDRDSTDSENAIKRNDVSH